MDQVTTSPAEDAELSSFGYRQQFTRSLHHFESFAVAFSFISITTGIFTTFGFALATGGPRAIWTWPIVIVAGERWAEIDGDAWATLATAAEQPVVSAALTASPL